jgi:hypothetical protein
MDLDQLRQAAMTAMQSAGTNSDEAPWHKWSDSSEVVGELIGVETFTRKDGEQATYARIDTEAGPVKVGLDYAVLKSEWAKHNPKTGDTVLIMRADEKATSNSGREFWPFGVSVSTSSGAPSAPATPPTSEPAQQGIVVLEDQVTKRNDPDDDIPF